MPKVVSGLGMVDFVQTGKHQTIDAGEKRGHRSSYFAGAGRWVTRTWPAPGSTAKFFPFLSCIVGPLDMVRRALRRWSWLPGG